MASQLRSLIGLQVISRAFTFILNQSLLGLASPGAYGTAAIQFELISSTILFLSREGVRNALLRVNRAKDGSWNVGNIVFLPLSLGVPLAVATSLGYVRLAAQETKSQPGFYTGIALYALAAVLELWCEPMHNHAMAEMKTHIRFRAEGSGVMAKTVTTFLVLFYDSKAGMNGALALVAFAWGQLSYSFCVMAVYLAHYGLSSLFPKKTSLRPDSDTLRISLTMTSQSVIKHFLTEGDKFVLGWFSPLQDQGGYAVAVNYGSLIARIVFQPIEESSRISFSKTLSPPIKAEALKTASRALTTLTSLQTSFSLLLLVFGPAYLPIVLPVILPRQYLSTSAPRVLQAWIWYIPVLALNGGLEAFISSVSTPKDLNRQSRWMAIFSIIYMAAAVQLYRWHFGDSSLVYANIINLTARIAYAAHFTTAFFASRGSSLQWRAGLPGAKFAAACAVSLGIITANEGRLGGIKNMVTHIGPGLAIVRHRAIQIHILVGGILGCLCLMVWWFTEGRQLLRERKHPKSD
ncbi:Oligosaccharide translocation protein RFT1 [Mycena indigotica]|uniref:Man(5)GlcNAc(2)-PP-dolichol translocation protein RFT1 n=1 Tax=Mycena indigotica TaxID=2126181 RepID=A0A8H6SB90_9AGAR|nr:Oligosaccharide translocation protein RFT1 [Mycena indigotica]KAF7294685.1 Oligosaccharide translocation protein RFT1 [Mycena indigotica]